jgi:two-component system CitB family response regulator
LELLQTLREQQQAVDVIMITAADETRLISQSLHLGMLDYLIKPFSFERFAQSIQVFQQRRESLKHPRIAQQQIDLLLQGNQKGPWIELEKGLTEDTLQLIQETIRTIKQPFTVQELAQACALSHVSVRKYVAHLEKTKAIRSENVYTKIGRPYKQYFLTYAAKQTTD